MLLDSFFDSVHYTPKRRVHFQEFIAEAHEAIDRGRKAAADPIASAAAEIASEAALLCFDELEVTDIADAMILGRLFQQLFAGNVVMVATSNTAPRDLYRDGLNRQLFTPFIKLVEERMEVHELESAKDYRLEKLQGSDLYLTPADARAGAAMDASFAKLTRRYQRIAHTYHTLMIEEIPVLGPEQRNEARRLITLIDVLYDNGVGLIASAAAEPHALYVDGAGAERFARTASRLMEMRSDAYLAERHKGGGHAGEPA